jgi:glycosyltransferase involved in cell wall biosynthesis
MKILHIIPTFPYFSENSIVGGAANALYNLAKVQSKDHAVTILGYLPSGINKTQITSDNVTIIPLNGMEKPSSVIFGLNSIYQTLWWITKHRNQFDLIHGHSGFIDYIITSYLVQKSNKNKVVHSLYCPVPNNFGRWNKSFYKKIIISSANKLNGLTAFSQNVKQTLMDYGIENNIYTTLPAVDLERFHPAQDSLKTRFELGFAEDDFIMLFVGNTKPAKNLLTVFKAFYEVRQILPQAKLVITTELDPTNREYALSLSRAMDELGIASSVVQFKIIDNMPALMRASDLLIAPFINTFGPSDYFMAALEAMSCGKPVIVSEVGGMPEIVDDSVGFLVEPLNVNQIKNAIIELATSPQKRALMGFNAARRAQEMFAPAKVAKQFNDIYESIK